MSLSTATLNALDAVMKGVGNAEELASAINNATSAIGSVTTAELAVLHGAVAGTPTASKAFVADANGDIGALKATSIALGASGSETTVTSTAAELNTLHSVTAGTVAASSAIVAGAAKQVDSLAVANLVSGTTTVAGSATQAITTISKKTAIVDNTPTSIFTVTCPNTTQTAVVEIILLAAVNNAGALDSARVAVGYIVFDRVAGAALVGTAAALTNTAIATSGSATLTVAYSLAAVGGSVSQPNTMDIQVTLVKTGGTNHQIVALATIINSEATGMTIAAV